MFRDFVISSHRDERERRHQIGRAGKPLLDRFFRFLFFRHKNRLSRFAIVALSRRKTKTAQPSGMTHHLRAVAAVQASSTSPQSAPASVSNRRQPIGTLAGPATAKLRSDQNPTSSPASRGIQSTSPWTDTGARSYREQSSRAAAATSGWITPIAP